MSWMAGSTWSRAWARCYFRGHYLSTKVRPLGLRLHLFEFGDQPWFPQILRDAETAYLATAYRFLSLMPRLWAEKISTIFDRGKPAEILDLCAGSGGAMPLIVEELEKRGYEVSATLTDLYPNPRSASHPKIAWLAEPVDATQVPPGLKGVRTMFSGFHHFRPDVARAILKDAFDLRRAICIFESGTGTLLGVAGAVLIPIHVLALMPFARPGRWAWLLFTYLIPLIPLVVLWDGIVSNLRIYSPRQMISLTEDFQSPDYAWEIGRIRMRGVPGGLPYLIGRPTACALPE
jgi:hypothetical protein